jgi:hypothetical protein
VDIKNVKRDNETRHNCITEKYGLTTVSAKNIAYAAVVVSPSYLGSEQHITHSTQARFCLSSKRIWNLKDGNFNYNTFYHSITMRLHDSNDPWVQDTISWWNE